MRAMVVQFVPHDAVPPPDPDIVTVPEPVPCAFLFAVMRRVPMKFAVQFLLVFVWTVRVLSVPEQSPDQFTKR